MTKTVQPDPFEAVERLAKAFGGLERQTKSKALGITRILNTAEVMLPDHAGFCDLACKAGKLLSDLPEHWRYGVQPRTMSEADPAKRWGGALFDYTLFGLVHLPNFDSQAHEERIDAPIQASVLACEVLLRFARLPHWGKGNLPAAIEAAREDAEEMLAKTGQESWPEPAILFICARAAFESACTIAKMSRSKTPSSPSQFVLAQTRLDEFMERAEKLVKESKVHWPLTPGTTFSWKAGDSAMDVALKFARMVRSVSHLGQPQSIASTKGWSAPDLRMDDPNPDPKIITWRDTVVNELQERTLQPPPAWPIWEIMRDEQRLISLLQDEYKRSLANDTGNGKLISRSEAARRLGVSASVITRLVTDEPEIAENSARGSRVYVDTCRIALEKRRAKRGHDEGIRDRERQRANRDANQAARQLEDNTPATRRR